MDSLSDQHKKNVNLLCRICAKRSKLCKEKTQAKLCDKYKDIIFTVYGIDVSSDNLHCYPKSFCKCCYRRIINYNHRVVTEGKCLSQNDIQAIERGKELNNAWDIRKCNDDCWICVQFNHQSKGGRPKKLRKQNKHQIISPNVFDTLFDDSFFTITGSFKISGLNEDQKVHFVCSICQDLYSPKCVKTRCQPCEHYFCSSCLTKAFQTENSQSIPCPVCKYVINVNDIDRVDWRFKSCLLSITVRCVSCDMEDELLNMRYHTCSVCEDKATSDVVTPPCPSQTSPFVNRTQPQKMTIGSCLKKSLDEPLDETEEKLLTHLVKRTFMTSSDKTLLRCETEGQPLLLRRIRKRRKTTSQAASPLKKRCSFENSVP